MHQIHKHYFVITIANLNDNTCTYLLIDTFASLESFEPVDVIRPTLIDLMSR